MLYVSKIDKVPKNRICGMFREINGSFYIIKGKYKGKHIYEIPELDLLGYCSWVLKNTKNDATLYNANKIKTILKDKI